MQYTMNKQELDATIKSLESAVAVAGSDNQTGGLTLWYILDTLKMLKGKESAKDDVNLVAQHIKNDHAGLNVPFIQSEMARWRAIKKEALSNHNDASIAISQCYIHAYQKVLDNHSVELDVQNNQAA